MIRANLFRIFLIAVLLQVINFDGSCQTVSDTLIYKKLTKFSLASIDYTTYSNSEYIKDQEVSEIEMEEYKVKFQFALKLKEKKTYLLNRISISRFDAFSTKGLSKKFSENYYSFSYNIGLIQILKNRWKVIGVVSPTLASDFNDKIGNNDFIVQSSLIISKRANTNFEYGFGAAYSTRFGHALAIPLISFTYCKGNWNHTGVLPAYLASYYTFHSIEIGAKLSTFGNVYNSTNVIKSNLELDKLGYSRINIGPEAKIKIYKLLYANVYAGVTVRNRLFSIDSRGGLEMELSADTKYFFNIGFSLLK